MVTTRRSVLQPNVELFVGGCGNLDDVNHLFLTCEIFGTIWFHIHVSNHLLQFRSPGGFSKNIRSVLHLI